MSSRKVARRRSVPIHAYVGPNGGGKSLTMVRDTIASLRAGRHVLSTVRLLDFDNPRPCPGCSDATHAMTVIDNETGEITEQIHAAAHPLYEAFTDYRQLLGFTDGDVLMDEVTGVASSRESHSMPPQIANYLVQLRRRNVMLRWTAPNWARADKIMREVSQAVTYCIGYMPKERRDAAETRVWRDRRLFFVRTYDANAFDEFTAHKRETVKAMARELFWRPGSLAERAYDTLDPVSMLGAVSERGLCIVCAGQRSQPRCSCPDQRSRGAVSREDRSARRAEDRSEAPREPVTGTARRRAARSPVSKR